jgi:hypothetical protein
MQVLGVSWCNLFIALVIQNMIRLGDDQESRKIKHAVGSIAFPFRSLFSDDESFTVGALLHILALPIPLLPVFLTHIIPALFVFLPITLIYVVIAVICFVMAETLEESPLASQDTSDTSSRFHYIRMVIFMILSRVIGCFIVSCFVQTMNTYAIFFYSGQRWDTVIRTEFMNRDETCYANALMNEMYLYQLSLVASILN